MGAVWWLAPLLERAWGLVGAAGHRLLAHRGLVWGAALIAVTFIFVQSYRRHVWFGSGGRDLGLFHQTVWLLSRLEPPYSTVLGMHAFADHMAWIQGLAAPLQWVWPDAGALLLFQSLCVGSAVLPVMWLVKNRFSILPGSLSPAGAGAAGLMVSAALMLSPDIQSAVMFDFNPQTCGAAFIPWVAWGITRPKGAAFWIPLALLALSKENLALYGAGLCLALALGGDDTGVKRRAWWGGAACLLLFALEMGVLFPLWQGGFTHLRYDDMGDSAGLISWRALQSPARSFALLFVPGNKIDGLLVSWSAFAWLSVLSPRFAWAALPGLLERFWSSHANRWWGHYYGAGLAMVAAVAAIDAVGRWIARGQTARAPATVGLVMTALIASSVLVSVYGRWGLGPLWLARAPYYTTPVDRADAEAVLAAVPAAASVAAQNHLLPHLSARKELYELSAASRAQVVVLDAAQDAWPLPRDAVPSLATTLWAEGYRPLACQGQAVVLQRQPEDGTGTPCPVLQSWLSR